MLVVATACTMNELMEPIAPSYSGDDVVTVSPRISHYTDCNVSTRSSKEGDEAKVTSMAMALFPIIDGEIQRSVYYQYNADGNMLFVLDRNKAPFTASNGQEPYIDKNFVMYIIANMQDAGIPKNSGYVDEDGNVAVYQPDGSVVIGGEKEPNCGAGWTVDEFVAKYHTIEDGTCFEKIGDNGLPMIGMLGDFSEFGDQKTFIFHPTKGEGNENGLPVVDGTPTDNLEIPMRALYAKFSFTISVESDQEIIGNAAPRFDLSGYKVNNASKKVYLSRSLNKDDDVTDYGDVASSEFHDVSTEGIYAQGATKATFFFYVPERTLDPATSLEEYVYDFGKDGAPVTGYSNIPPELKKYAQRFKPMLVSEDQNATHVAIKGTFTDHQKHVYDVTYNIYLGKDNYGDFNIIRNTHYNNFITIRGIDTAYDQSADYDPDNDDDEAPISIDHRVSIDRTTPLVVGLRRETLLDAHIEVRPLRLHLSGGDPETNPTSATVTLAKAKDTDPELSTWIGMEKADSRTAGETAYIIAEGTSYGKRKYFTDDLISSISGNTSITVENLGYDANQTIWLYVDENATTESRSAILRIQYDYIDPVTGVTAAPEEYVITQHGLHEVTYNGQTYYMERFEEYLYNFDTDDLFGQTNQAGMPWGLDGVQLSSQHMAALPDKLDNYSDISENRKNEIKNNVDSYYDFYIDKYDSSINTPDPENDMHIRKGWDFCKEIIAEAGIGALALNATPQSAVEYCHNKNKRNANGIVEDVVWYLPAVDEIEDVIVGAYNEYHEFQEYDYWSCQPSYHRCYFFMSKHWDRIEIFGNVLNPGTLVRGNFDYYTDDILRARSTNAEFTGNTDANGTPILTYEPSGITVPPSTIGNRTVNGSSKEFTIQSGYYTWKTRRGDNIANGYDEDGNWTDYDYDGAHIDEDDKRVYPEFGEDPYRQSGNKLRTDNARVRCLRKM